MGKYDEVITWKPAMEELNDLRTLINNDLRIFNGSGFADELIQAFEELDSTLHNSNANLQEEIYDLKNQIAELEKEVEELNDRL